MTDPAPEADVDDVYRRLERLERLDENMRHIPQRVDDHERRVTAVEDMMEHVRQTGDQTVAEIKGIRGWLKGASWVLGTLVVVITAAVQIIGILT